MKRHSEKGMALVITLMMLAIVTFLAVIFLAMSRRERANVKIHEDQANAKSLADQALARSQAEIIARMQGVAEAYLNSLNNTNLEHIAHANGAIQRARFHYDLNVSKNYLNPAGFTRNDTNTSNVNYWDANGNPLQFDTDDYFQNIANLQYDARPPVYVDTTNGLDFRFYLDLNRNGKYETNGYVEIRGPNGERYNANGSISTASRGVDGLFSGDPDWIGVLERPDFPHSETNRFVGRYAYLVLPAGKSLDLNYIHNASAYTEGDTEMKYAGGATQPSRFTRNQGVGSWELNLGGFLVDYAPDIWRPLNDNFYRYTNTFQPQASGLAFKAAAGLLQYRLNFSRTNLLTPFQSLTNRNLNPPFAAAPEGTRWGTNFVDETGDGPFPQYDEWATNSVPLRSKQLFDNDNDRRYWHGGERYEKTLEFADVQRLFKLTNNATSDLNEFAQKFVMLGTTNKDTTYNRYAYYRWIGQMGVDSIPTIRGKIHLNFTNEPGTLSTNLRPWVAAGGPLNLPRPMNVVTDTNGVMSAQTNTLTNFFLIAADAMLRASLVTNVFLDNFNRWRTNYTVGGSYFTDTRLNVMVGANRPVANLPVRPDISVTNIQIYHDMNGGMPTLNHLTATNAEYSAAVHRILQLAANIYDNMTNRGPRNPQGNPRGTAEPYSPSVFRPVYTVTPTNVLITGWQWEDDGRFARQTNFTWVTRQELLWRGNGVYTNFHVWGQPWIIGAKKGWPNFNEFSIETFIQVTRKLAVFKSAAGQVLTTNLADLVPRTRQIYMIGISNTFGIEAWNSYARTLGKQIEIGTEVRSIFGIDRLDKSNNILGMAIQPYAITNYGGFLSISNWPGRNNIAPHPAEPELIVSKQANGLNGTNSPFRVPLHSMNIVLPDTQWEPNNAPPYFGRFFTGPAAFQPLNYTPNFRLNITNRMRYYAIDRTDNRVVDFVTLDDIVTHVNLTEMLRGETNVSATAFAEGAFDPGALWDPTPVDKTADPTMTGMNMGMLRQMLISLGHIPVDQGTWKDYSPTMPNTNQIGVFQEFLSLDTDNENLRTDISRQVPFTPTRRFYLQTKYQANDPLVHYMLSDLKDPYQQTKPSPLRTQQKNDELGKINVSRMKIRPDRYNTWAYSDPGIGNSDDWKFPIARLDNLDSVSSVYGIANFVYRYPNLGALGQIHRGTPWQTVYLKADSAQTIPTASQTNAAVAEPYWAEWSGSYGTHPTNDWKLVGLFTTALSESGVRGLLSINQTNIAAWSAVLSGIPVITNSTPDGAYLTNRFARPRWGNPDSGYADLLIEPGSWQLSNIVTSITQYRRNQNRAGGYFGSFAYLGEILGAPGLSTASPYLNKNPAQFIGGAFTDEQLEAIPSRILSLIKEDEPRVVIYAFGQTLKPAPRSFVTSSDFYNLCVNYQVTGEYATKAVVRVEGELKNPANPLRTVVESFEALPPFD